MNSTFKAKKQCRDQCCPPGQRKRQRAGRLLQLFRDIGSRVPAAIGEVDEEEADEELAEDRRGAGAYAGIEKWIPTSGAERKAGNQKQAG